MVWAHLHWCLWEPRRSSPNLYPLGGEWGHISVAGLTFDPVVVAAFREHPRTHRHGPRSTALLAAPDWWGAGVWVSGGVWRCAYAWISMVGRARFSKVCAGAPTPRPQTGQGTPPPHPLVTCRGHRPPPTQLQCGYPRAPERRAHPAVGGPARLPGRPPETSISFPPLTAGGSTHRHTCVLLGTPHPPPPGAVC